MPLLKFGYQTDSRSTPVSKKLLRPKQKAMPRQPRESPPQALIDNNASLPSPSSGEAHGASTAQDSICGKEKLGIVSICSGCSSIHSSLIDFLGCCIGGEFVRIFSILPYWFVLPIRTTDEQAAMQWWQKTNSYPPPENIRICDVYLHVVICRALLITWQSYDDQRFCWHFSYLQSICFREHWKTCGQSSRVFDHAYIRIIQ